MIKLNKIKLTSVEMTTREFDTLNDLIQHGRHDVADNEFDTRSNTFSSIWGYEYMTSLLSAAVVDVKTGNETDYTMVTVTFLDLAIPAVLHMLYAISIEVKTDEKPTLSSMELRGLIKKIENDSNPKQTIKSVIRGAKNDQYIN